MMKLSRKTLVSLSLCLSLAQSAASKCNAADPTLPDQQVKPVHELLSLESRGQVVNRRSLNSSRPADQWSAWQAGYLKLNNSWLGLDDLSSKQSDQEYEAKRESLRGQADAHLLLARWCREHDRPDAARAHSLAYLVDHPEHRESHENAGHQLVNGTWLDKEELEADRQELRNQVAAIQHWSPKLKQIFEDMRSNNTTRVKRALERLESIDTAAALPVLAIAAANTDRDLALPLVRKIAEVKSTDACQALVMIALENESMEVHAQAVKAIKSYPHEFFVPKLLRGLASEMTIEQQQRLQPNGVITRTVVVKQELQNKSVERNLNQSINLLSSFFAAQKVKFSMTEYGEEYIWSIRQKIPKTAPVKTNQTTSITKTGVASGSLAVNYVPTELAVATAKTNEELNRQEKLAVEQANRASQEMTKPVYALLRETTNESYGNDARLWWDWWCTKNERYRPLKPVEKTYAYQKLQLAEQSYKFDIGENRYMREVPGVLVQHSCLVAGTPVQTSTGLVPVEKIEVGDLVPCQNIETGELSLQPVILTTIRQPVDTLKIVTADETIQATGGHLWWVSGQGWTKTRDLKPGLTLHTADASVAVKDIVAVEEPLTTYNLIVDKNHTYFVGKNRILSYDNSPLEPTLKTLPGYVSK